MYSMSKLKQVITICLSQLVVLIFSAVKDDYTIYHVIGFNQGDREQLFKLQDYEPCISFLNGITNKAYITMEVAVHTECVKVFETELRNADIEFTKVSQLHVDLISGKEELRVNNSTEFMTFIHKFSVTQKINDLMIKHKHKKYPYLFEKIIIGKSHQGHNLTVFRMGPRQNNNSHAVFILGGEEGRDWISPAILLKVLAIMVFKKPAKFEDMWDYYEFYFMPLLNPDGYHYSKHHDRFWEKNRNSQGRRHCVINEASKLGVNIDRNWNTIDDVSTITNCMREKIGGKPLSEPETRALSQFLNSISSRTLVFINIRGFGRMITIPHGYPPNQTDNFPIVFEILLTAQNELQKIHNATYDIGLMADMLYLSFGGCADWVKDTLDVPVVYTLFMSGYDYSAPATSFRLNTDDLSNQLLTFLGQVLSYTKIIYGSLANKQEHTTPSIYVIMSIASLIIYLNSWNCQPKQN